MQHTATQCNTLQHVATGQEKRALPRDCYSSRTHSATYCNTLQHTVTHCIWAGEKGNAQGLLQPRIWWRLRPIGHGNSVIELSCGNIPLFCKEFHLFTKIMSIHTKTPWEWAICNRILLWRYTVCLREHRALLGWCFWPVCAHWYHALARHAYIHTYIHTLSLSFSRTHTHTHAHTLQHVRFPYTLSRIHAYTLSHGVNFFSLWGYGVFDFLIALQGIDEWGHSVEVLSCFGEIAGEIWDPSSVVGTRLK